MKCEIQYADGRSSETCDSLQRAAQILEVQYAGDDLPVIYDAGGFAVNGNTQDDLWDVRGDLAGRCWLTEAGSQNDDGARAVASIRVIADEE